MTPAVARRRLLKGPDQRTSWLLPAYRLRDLNLYAIYPSRQFLDARIKTWVEHLRATLPEALASEERDLQADA